MGYAFISYSSKNNEYACTIRNILNKNGIETWMAPESIPAGSKYAAEITKAVRNCSCFVLLLSNFSQASDAVDGEVELAKLTFKKPIVTIQIEDVELNDSFLFYLKNTHTVSVYKIEEKSETIKSVLSDIEKYTGKQQIRHNRENSQNLKNLNKNHNIELTVHSPVNTDVYLNNKKHPVMRIDLNSGFNYKHNTINVSESFELIFSSKGFEKIVAFETVGNKIDYNLNAILSQKEIMASYDREEALEQILYEPTSYAFEQLAVVGLAEDTLLLKEIFHELSSDKTDDSHKNYLIAECALALGTLAIKYNDFESAREIPSVYEKYPAKGSYGYLFEKIMKNLIKGLNDFTEKSDVITDDMDFEKVLNKKTEERETKSKAEKKTVNKNKFAFSPIAPPARLQAPAVVGKLEQKNDTNNMSSENKSDDFDEDQFYIMINDLIKGKAETEVEYKKTMPKTQTKKEEFNDMFSGITSYEEELRVERELKAMREDIKKRAEIEIDNMLKRRDSEEYVGKGTEKNCVSSEDEDFDELYKLLYHDFKTKRLKANVCALTHTGASCKANTNNYSLSGRTSMSENPPFIRTVTTDLFHLLVTNSLGRDGEKISRELINKLNYSSEKVYELAKKQQDMESVIVNCIDVAKKSIISNTIFKKQTSETSLAALYFIGEVAYCINIGNTRIYHYSEGKIKRIIRGRIDPKDFTNCLEKGIYSSVEQIRDVKENDVFLLCSNGVTDVIDIDTILYILSTSENSMDATARLVQTSLDRGGKDNITAITAFMETESVIERK